MIEFGSASSRKVIKVLEEAGYEAVFVGGSVRDYLLGKDASDIDIATSASPEEVKQVFPNTIDVGIEHGTVLVLMDREPIEVTTYRTESTYTDHRRPDEVKFVKSLNEDLRRRDFTINALALTVTGELIDPFGGRDDLKGQVIRAVGNAHDRFMEDALRMVRAVRFASVLGFEVEANTRQAISVNAETIRHVSVERIKVEMDKLMKGKEPNRGFALIAETGLSRHLPLFPQDIRIISESVPYESALEGWAAFMLSGGFSASELARAYKLSNREKEFLSAVQAAFDRRQMECYTTDDYYRFTFNVLCAAEKIWQAFNPSESGITQHKIAMKQSELPIRSKEELRVNGKDLMAWTGQRGGPWLGEWMNRIEKSVLHRKCPNDTEKIKEWFLSEYKRQE